jgi:ACS family tartrate transporter-like MFS transporter
MVSWGLVSIAMVFVNGPTMFYALRFLLGVAEAGFFPGMVLYLTYWFPSYARSAVMGIFIIANPISTVIGAPLSTALLDIHLFGLTGWQTMFVIEGVPAILLGVVVLFVLCDSPSKAHWLSAGERELIERAVERDSRTSSHVSLRAGLASAHVWRFTLVYLGLMVGVYGFGFWAPQMIKSLGNLENTQVGWFTAIPYACATVAMCLWGRHSDRSGVRMWHFALPALLGAAGFIYGSFTNNLYLAIAAFTAGAIGIYSSLPVFWTLSTAVLTGSAAAGGIALINSIGNLSGWGGPYVIGRLKESTGGYSLALMLIAASLAFAGLFGAYAGRRR